jgi:tellurite resistance protein TerA
MQILTRGQKLKLADLSASQQWQIGVSAQASNLAFDISCFGIDAEGKLSDDRYFIFFNQKSSPEGALQLGAVQDGDDAVFALDLARLPATIRRLVFVITIDGDGTMAGLNRGHVRFLANGAEAARFEFQGSDFGPEKAIMAAEIYSKDVWRIAAVGQGFAGGLSAVLKHFGGEEIAEDTPPALPSNTVTPTKSVPQPPPEAPTAPPRLINLDKAGSSVKIDLGKKVGEILATATWIDNGDSSDDNDDLDLRAGILFPNGSMSMVTCTNPGSLHNKPYVLHEGDVTGASVQQPGQETMRVNPAIADKYDGDIAIVFSIYSAISNGAVSIASLHPKMKLQYGNQIVECAIDFSKDKAARKEFVYTYVIGLAIISNGQIEISPGGQVSEPHSEATPWLQWNGKGTVKLTMDGPMVIKDADDDFADLLDDGSDKRYI